MCGIYGALFTISPPMLTQLALKSFQNCAARGDDSWGMGYVKDYKKEFNRVVAPGSVVPEGFLDRKGHLDPHQVSSLIGNFRGEPTTEWVLDKTEADCQPFISPSGRWCFTHNGTIANDKEIGGDLWDDYLPTPIDSWVIGLVLDAYGFEKGIKELLGSFAILAIDLENPDQLQYAVNYKPLYVLGGPSALIQVASQPEYLERLEVIDNPSVFDSRPFQIKPYTIGTIHRSGKITSKSLYPPKKTGKKRVLAVCSGGLDSSTVAWMHYKDGDCVELFHVRYGCKAQSNELLAVHDLASMMNTKVNLIDSTFFSNHANSILTDDGVVNKSGDGEAGTEYAHEWVPARNLVLLSMAIAYAEAHDFDTIAFGSNIEEAGAFPDNTVEFINKLNDTIPYAVKPYHQMEISHPSGGWVKHKIVREGLRLGMPYEYTWSCYEGGKVPCNSCGPCQMRRTAFEMNDSVDPLLVKHHLAKEK